jgi:quinol monooxygenase YgiN
MTDTDSDESIYYSDEEENNNKCIEKYELTVWKAYNNLQYYILRKATNYDNNTMFENYYDLDTFKSQPENKKFISEINRLIKKFNIKKYEHHLEQLRQLHNGYFYATVLEIDDLWDACVGLEYKYNNINILYDNYEEVHKYYNP